MYVNDMYFTDQEKHIFISYQWDNQDVILQINNRLKVNNNIMFLQIWFALLKYIVYIMLHFN